MFTEEINIILAIITSFATTYIAIPKIIDFSHKYRLADVAGIRASHEGSIPVFGGIAIFLGIIFSLLFWWELENSQFIIASLFIVFFTGVIDDLLTLSPFKKIIGQIIAILILIYLADISIYSMHGVLGIYELPNVVSALFTVFVVVVIINGVNLIDGVDGLASGVALIASFAFGAISLLMNQYDMAILAFTLMGSLLGFLKYNLHPAKIFMGDTGSLVVGLILSVLAINIIKSGLIIGSIQLPNKGPLLAIAFLAIPLFDSLRVFIARLIKGRHPLQPGRGHIHHALLTLGFGHRLTSFILYNFSIFLICLSYFLLDFNINSAIAVLAFVAYLFLLIPFILLKKKTK